MYFSVNLRLNHFEQKTWPVKNVKRGKYSLTLPHFWQKKHENLRSVAPGKMEQMWVESIARALWPTTPAYFSLFWEICVNKNLWGETAVVWISKPRWRHPKDTCLSLYRGMFINHVVGNFFRLEWPLFDSIYDIHFETILRVHIFRLQVNWILTERFYSKIATF